MIERLTVQNFRCFKRAEIKNLTRINIIVGRNSSGKTALLESIFLGNGNPELIFRVRGQRLGEGIGAFVSGSGETTPIQQIVRPLFNGFDLKRSIEVKAFGPGVNTVAKISESESVLKYEFQPKGTVGKSKTHAVRLTSDGELKISPPAAVEHKLAFFASNIKNSPVEASRRFSELSRRDEIKEFVTSLRTALPDLEDLSIEIESGVPMVFAKMNTVAERLPVQYVSDGISRLLNILIGISSTSRGVILIDELENGIYHQTFPAIINAIREFATKYDVQLFITTHSKELLQAFADAAAGNEDDFALLRLESGNVEQFGGVSFRSAIQQDIEVR